MTEKLPCSECGALILPITFELTGGVCMACRNGIRKNIERSKRWNEERRNITDPLRELWASLVDRVYKSKGGFQSLNHHEKVYFCLGILEGEVFNGGFEQYFANSSGSYYNETIQALEEIGALKSRELLKKAKEVLFPGRPVPAETEDRRRSLPDYPDDGNPAPQWSKKLTQLDSLFCKDPDGIAEKMKKFAEANGLVIC